VTRILLFDIDMTMVRTDGGGRAAMEDAFEREFGVAKATQGMLFDGRTDRGIFFDCLERHGLGGEGVELRYQRLRDLYLELMPGWLERKGGIVLPGVPELLESLAGGEAVVGLATGNLRRGAEHKLRYFGLWEHFSGGGFGDSHVVRTELVREGIAELVDRHCLEAGACEVIVLGDTPLDVEAAHGAGARAFGVATGRFSAEELRASGAEFAVDNLSETGRVLEMLLG
jgi:phosphoglycolate phosphatase-like HAD superfamily hydrolase